MRHITLIAAIGKNNELGKDNDLIWKFKEDMRFFKQNTMGKPIVMGMNTLKSLPGLLPGRKHIVLTTRNIELDPRIVICHSIDELLDYMDGKDEEFMIIGGASIYKQTIEHADKMLLTEIEACDKEADVFFPSFNRKDWDSIDMGIHEENNIKYRHLVYTKKGLK